MRSFLFNLAFWPVLGLFALVAWVIALTGWTGGVRALMRTACRTVRGLMHLVLGGCRHRGECDRGHERAGCREAPHRLGRLRCQGREAGRRSGPTVPAS